eukprot:gene19443-25323_t
MEELGQEKLC